MICKDKHQIRIQITANFTLYGINDTACKKEHVLRNLRQQIVISVIYIIKWTLYFWHIINTIREFSKADTLAKQDYLVPVSVNTNGYIIIDFFDNHHGNTFLPFH